MSPIANTSACPGSVRSGSTVTLPARSRSAPVSSPSRPARPEAVTPAAQITTRLATRSVAPSPSASVTPSSSIPTTVRPGEDRDAEPPQGALGLRGERGREARQHAVCGLHEEDARAARIDVAEVATQRVERQLADLARHLDAGRAAADDDEREPGVAISLVRRRLGCLEGGEEAAAGGECALDRLHLDAVRPPVVVPEVGVGRAARDDEAVVVQPPRARARRTSSRAAPRVHRGRSRGPRQAARERCAGA